MEMGRQILRMYLTLTAGGTQQGLFPWFDAKSGSSQLYINAEWIQAGTIKGREVEEFIKYRLWGNVFNSSDGSLDLYFQALSGNIEKRGSIYQQGGAMRIKPLGRSYFIYWGICKWWTSATYPVGSWNFECDSY